MKWLDSLGTPFSLGLRIFLNFLSFIVRLRAVFIYLMARVPARTLWNRLLLNPADPILRRAGEWWRVVTFLFVPPMDMNPIFLVFWLLLLYQYAQALEAAWGEFRFFFFYLIGAVATSPSNAPYSSLHEPLGKCASLNTTHFSRLRDAIPKF